MTACNKYIFRSKISEAKTRELIRLFVADLNATPFSQLTCLKRNTVNRILTGIRERIAGLCARESPVVGPEEKQLFFGLFKQNGAVYAEIVPDCSKATLQVIIAGPVDLESVIHSDGWRGYDGLVDLGYQKHFRVQHGENEFANGTCHINGIESFWGYAKTRLVRFRGMSKKTFHLHLKECELDLTTGARISTRSSSNCSGKILSPSHDPI